MGSYTNPSTFTASSADTLTNKSIDGSTNTVSNIANLSVKRQLNTTNSTVTGTRIETGVSGITNSVTKAVTFNTPFTTPPIVIVTNIGGDAATATIAYPAANPSAFNDRTISAVSQSTTGFTAQMTGSVSGTTQVAEFTWIAIGN